MTATKPIPINVAEAIIEPFWAPELSRFSEWEIDTSIDSGIRIKQNWSAVDFEWDRPPDRGPALRMSRRMNVDCCGYDILVVCATLPKRSALNVIVETDKGDRSSVSEPAQGGQIEHLVQLAGASSIRRITLEIIPGDPQHRLGWLSWIGLQNSGLMSEYFRQWDYSRIDWGKHLKSDEYLPEFQPRYQIFMTVNELERLRSEHEREIALNGSSRYTRIRDNAVSITPELGISEFVGSGGRTRMHGRIRDSQMPRLSGNTELAVAGLVLRDPHLLRLAARYALSMATSGHWENGFMSQFPTSSWEDRAFRRSYACSDIAMILDLAGEIFTDAGRNYLLRRLAEEGIGPINYVTWRHEYIFHCNQLAYFNAGRMAAYLVLERELPRVKPYTDLACRDSQENLTAVIEPDGGYLEGPSYFCPTVRENCKVLKFYARARGLEYAGIVPDVLAKTSNFAALIISTTADDVIPICDAGPNFREDTLNALLELMPDSYWSILREKQIAQQNGADIRHCLRQLPPFLSLPDTGHVASLRFLDDQPVKILIIGNKKGADHTHEDKGSFVLEFAGETFAADLGICDYGDPIHTVYKQCQRHNMLVPVGTDTRAHPLNPLPFDVKPSAEGDEVRFRAAVDATPGWGGFFKRWLRVWESPSPRELVIRDELELDNGSGVAFYWQTRLPVERHNRGFIIKGRKGTIELSAQCDEAKVEKLPLADGESQNRIAFLKSGLSGTIEVYARMSIR